MSWAEWLSKGLRFSRAAVRAELLEELADVCEELAWNVARQGLELNQKVGHTLHMHQLEAQITTLCGLACAYRATAQRERKEALR